MAGCLGVLVFCWKTLGYGIEDRYMYEYMNNITSRNENRPIGVPSLLSLVKGSQ